MRSLEVVYFCFLLLFSSQHERVYLKEHLQGQVTGNKLSTRDKILTEMGNSYTHAELFLEICYCYWGNSPRVILKGSKKI